MKSGAEAGTPRACDLIVRNAYVITMDGERTVHERGAVAIDGAVIAAVGSAAEIEAAYRGRRVIDAGGAAVHPGFVDTHFHSTVHIVSKLFGDAAASSRGAGPWVAERYTRLHNQRGAEDDLASTLLACAEMLRAGFTAFMEPGSCFAQDLCAEGIEAIGMRASLCESYLMDVKGPQLSAIERAPLDLDRCLADLGNQLRRNADPDALVRGHVAIYGMGSQSEELTRAAKACADENDAPFTMHQSQCADDAEFDAERFGSHPMVYWQEIGVLDSRCVMVHMNHLWEDELDPIVDSGMTPVWVPGNTFYYATRREVPSRMAELFHRGVNVTLGQDVSKAWAFGQGTLLAYYIAREEGHYLSPADLIQIQTINGARAMGLEDRIGSLEPGKRADIVIRTTDLPEAYPLTFPERGIALQALSKAVDTVLVDGRVVLRGGRLTNMDEAVIYADAQASAERLVAAADAA